jgi:hypothetical protein
VPFAQVQLHVLLVDFTELSRRRIWLRFGADRR